VLEREGERRRIMDNKKERNTHDTKTERKRKVMIKA